MPRVIQAFVPFDSADILRVFPPFPAHVKFEGLLLTKQDALRAWRWRHPVVAPAAGAQCKQRPGGG